MSLFHENKIINLDKHPINSNHYLDTCKKKLKDKSVLQLDDFLSSESLKNIQKEANALHSKAYYCSQNHTILLTKKKRSNSCNILQHYNHRICSDEV